MNSTPVPEIVIFGATHVGIRLADRLARAARRVLVIDRAAEAPEPSSGWEYASSDFTVPDDIGRARVVYAVTDEDKLNIRIALAVRNASSTVPVVITLIQSRLGKKLARHLEHFSFINAPELAAQKFVDAVYAPTRSSATSARAIPAETEKEITEPWKPDPLIVRAVCFIGALAILATCYFHVAEHLSWIDAVYFVVTMMATVGFGDFNLRDAKTLSKIIGILLMIASVTNTAVIFALITDSLLKKRIALSFGRRRVKQSGHVIVAGIGSIGLRVVEELLKRGEYVVVIDSQEHSRFLPAIYAKRVPTIIGDARIERTLRDAGMQEAKALLCVTRDDLTNLEVGLNAKLLNPRARVVLRIYDRLLAQSLDERLDIHFAFSMSLIAAEVLVRFAEEPVSRSDTRAQPV
ncbi:MAG TPA: potassium channel family protein [Blastocatellia bacterium]|nr:potassium channel family protein [Blastocatellia bacterium]